MVRNDARTTAKFLYEYVFTRYGLPIEIVSDQGVHFANEAIEFLLNEFMVIHRKSAPYHPQANGQAKSTNKTFCFALAKVVEGNHSDWNKNYIVSYGHIHVLIKRPLTLRLST